MIKIFWSILWISTIVFFVAYIRMRARIPFNKREKFEKWLMLTLILLLLVDIGLVILERREISYEMNDCIRFYRYFPYFYNDSEFHFINKWCYNYFDEDEIETLRKSGEQYNNPVKPVAKVYYDEETFKLANLTK